MQPEQQLKHVLQLARKAIQELKQSLALEYLRSILRDVESLPGTSVSAEYRLLYADALALSNTTAESAESEFKHAIHEIFDLAASDVDLEPLESDEDVTLVRDLIRRHVAHTGSDYAQRVSDDWAEFAPMFLKIMPRDYKRVLAAERKAAAEGRAVKFAELVGVPA